MITDFFEKRINGQEFTLDGPPKFFNMIPPPPTEHVKEMYTLLKQLDHWESVGNKEIARELWTIISNRSKERAENISQAGRQGI